MRAAAIDTSLQRACYIAVLRWINSDLNYLSNERSGIQSKINALPAYAMRVRRGSRGPRGGCVVVCSCCSV